MAKKTRTLKQDEMQVLLRKKVFTRAIPRISYQHSGTTTSVNEFREAPVPSLMRKIMTQDDFLAELNPQSHAINDRLKYPNKLVREKREVNGEMVTYTRETEIARISLPLQSMIATRQTVHLWANPPKFTSKRKTDVELFARFKEYWKEKNASSAMYLMAKSAKTTGDGAIYFFMTENGLAYKVWSYADGDQLIPIYKKNGIDMEKFIRRYYSVPDGQANAVDTVDIFTATSYSQFQMDGNEWKMTIPETSHGFMQIPIVYHRESDVAWGVGQETIETIELFLSDVRESGRYFSFGILFLSGDDVEVLPTKETQGKVIISKDPNGNAKLLEQTDMSASLKFEFDQYVKSLYQSTGTVIIDLEMLKGGDQSGAYIKNLYNDAIQYALDSRPKWQPALEKLVSVVKEGLGIEEKQTLDYKNLVVISEPDIYVPMNIAEEIRLVNESMTAGSISRETVAETHKLASPDEYQRIQKQLGDEKSTTDNTSQQNSDTIVQ